MSARFVTKRKNQTKKLTAAVKRCLRLKKALGIFDEIISACPGHAEVCSELSSEQSKGTGRLRCSELSSEQSKEA